MNKRIFFSTISTIGDYDSYLDERFGLMGISQENDINSNFSFYMEQNVNALGKTATITSVGGEGALRCRLLDMGLIPKTVVTLQKIAPMGDPIEIHLRGYELTLRLDEARQIEVVPTSEGGRPE